MSNIHLYHLLPAEIDTKNFTLKSRRIKTKKDLVCLDFQEPEDFRKTICMDWKWSRIYRTRINNGRTHIYILDLYYFSPITSD